MGFLRNATNIKDKLKLEPTAALVMLWAAELYRNGPAAGFFNQLDLSSGQPLFKQCEAICNWYKEIILNRKTFIKFLIEQELKQGEQAVQLVFLASGKSPMPLEIGLSDYNMPKVKRIFEVDISGLEEKEKLYEEVIPDLERKPVCIQADITSINLPEILRGRGYSRDIPSIIVMEGISYYLSKQELNNIITGFRSAKRNIFIIEYLVPEQEVAPARRYIPEEIFKSIQLYCESRPMTTYTQEEMQIVFKDLGGEVVAGYTMVDMELKRTGTNTYFNKPNDGWIECATGKTG